jgi:hypothetical protein
MNEGPTCCPWIEKIVHKYKSGRVVRLTTIPHGAQPVLAHHRAPGLALLRRFELPSLRHLPEEFQPPPLLSPVCPLYCDRL